MRISFKRREHVKLRWGNQRWRLASTLKTSHLKKRKRSVKRNGGNSSYMHPRTPPIKLWVIVMIIALFYHFTYKHFCETFNVDCVWIPTVIALSLLCSLDPARFLILRIWVSLKGAILWPIKGASFQLDLTGKQRKVWISYNLLVYTCTCIGYEEVHVPAQKSKPFEVKEVGFGCYGNAMTAPPSPL